MSECDGAIGHVPGSCDGAIAATTCCQAGDDGGIGIEPGGDAPPPGGGQQAQGYVFDARDGGDPDDSGGSAGADLSFPWPEPSAPPTTDYMHEVVDFNDAGSEGTPFFVPIGGGGGGGGGGGREPGGIPGSIGEGFIVPP